MAPGKYGEKDSKKYGEKDSKKYREKDSKKYGEKDSGNIRKKVSIQRMKNRLTDIDFKVS